MTDTFEDLLARLRSAREKREADDALAGITPHHRKLLDRQRAVRNEVSWREDDHFIDDWSQQGNGEFQL